MKCSVSRCWLLSRNLGSDASLLQCSSQAKGSGDDLLISICFESRGQRHPWHAEGSTKHSDRYAILLRLIETSWKLKAEADGYDLSPLLRVMVLLPVGEGSDMGHTYSSTMWNTQVLGRAESKTLHRSQAESLSLSLQVPPQVCHDTDRTAVLNLRSGLEQCSLCGAVLSLAVSLGLVEL